VLLFVWGFCFLEILIRKINGAKHPLLNGCPALCFVYTACFVIPNGSFFVTVAVKASERAAKDALNGKNKLSESP